MRLIFLSVLVLILCACSKEPQDNSNITLTIDGKTALSDKAEGSQLPQFNSKHGPLIDAVLAACEKRESIADLRKILETDHKMNASAEIELEKETGHSASVKTLLVKKMDWKVTVRTGTFSCSQSMSN
jgi:hypothetical protein